MFSIRPTEPGSQPDVFVIPLPFIPCAHCESSLFNNGDNNPAPTPSRHPLLYREWRMAFVRTRARSNNNWWSGGWWWMRRVVGLHERVLLPHREEETIIIMGNEKTMIKWRKASVSLKWTLDLFLCRPCLQSGLGWQIVWWRMNEWMGVSSCVLLSDCP